MRLRLFFTFLAALSYSCSIDYFPTRVDLANRAVVSFLIKYTRVQSNVFGLTRRYADELVPDGRSQEWHTLAHEYDSVKTHRYTCRFNLDKTRFVVTCVPEPSSGLRISFYVDETRAIRLSAEGVAGPASPRLRLVPEEERELYGDPRSSK